MLQSTVIKPLWTRTVSWQSIARCAMLSIRVWLLPSSYLEPIGKAFAFKPRKGTPWYQPLWCTIPHQQLHADGQLVSLDRRGPVLQAPPLASSMYPCQSTRFTLASILTSQKKISISKLLQYRSPIFWPNWCMCFNLLPCILSWHSAWCLHFDCRILLIHCQWANVWCNRHVNSLIVTRLKKVHKNRLYCSPIQLGHISVYLHQGGATINEIAFYLR